MIKATSGTSWHFLTCVSCFHFSSKWQIYTTDGLLNVLVVAPTFLSNPWNSSNPSYQSEIWQPPHMSPFAPYPRASKLYCFHLPNIPWTFLLISIFMVLTLVLTHLGAHFLVSVTKQSASWLLWLRRYPLTLFPSCEFTLYLVSRINLGKMSFLSHHF